MKNIKEIKENQIFKSFEEWELTLFPEQVKKRKLTKIENNPKALGYYLAEKSINKIRGIKFDENELLDKILKKFKNDFQPRLF